MSEVEVFGFKSKSADRRWAYSDPWDGRGEQASALYQVSKRLCPTPSTVMCSVPLCDPLLPPGNGLLLGGLDGRYLTFLLVYRGHWSLSVPISTPYTPSVHPSMRRVQFTSQPSKWGGQGAADRPSEVHRQEPTDTLRERCGGTDGARLRCDVEQWLQSQQTCSQIIYLTNYIRSSPWLWTSVDLSTTYELRRYCIYPSTLPVVLSQRWVQLCRRSSLLNTIPADSEYIQFTNI